ncbi:hypothetical protein HK098_005476 [Nowakowskiella sp. JEL0407]|nr:hypothetical protein HK098_005476 [Nowakowskiella sp. JEL0407]
MSSKSVSDDSINESNAGSVTESLDNSLSRKQVDDSVERYDHHESHREGKSESIGNATTGKFTRGPHNELSHLAHIMSGYSNSVSSSNSDLFSSLTRYDGKGLSLYSRPEQVHGDSKEIPHEDSGHETHKTRTRTNSKDSEALSTQNTSFTGTEVDHNDVAEVERQTADSSLDELSENPPRPVPPPTSRFFVLKIRNISWDLSIDDVIAYFGSVKIPVAHEPPHYTQGVHIIMNRETGKTYSECFVEFPDQTTALRALEKHPKGLLKGRLVTVHKSSQEELLRLLFPRWKTSANEDQVTQPEFAEIDKKDIVYQGGIIYGGAAKKFAKEGAMITREEISAILLTCRYYKLHFSRKCAERPFENIISILCKIPWDKAGVVSTVHRDHIFEMLKLATTTLYQHLSKDTVSLSESLLVRLVRAGICVPTFTDRQKSTLLKMAKLQCPEDLLQFYVAPAEEDEQNSEINQYSDSSNIFMEKKNMRNRNTSFNSPRDNNYGSGAENTFNSGAYDNKDFETPVKNNKDMMSQFNDRNYPPLQDSKRTARQPNSDPTSNRHYSTLGYVSPMSPSTRVHSRESTSRGTTMNFDYITNCQHQVDTRMNNIEEKFETMLKQFTQTRSDLEELTRLQAAGKEKLEQELNDKWNKNVNQFMGFSNEVGRRFMMIEQRLTALDQKVEEIMVFLRFDGEQRGQRHQVYSGSQQNSGVVYPSSIQGQQRGSNFNTAGTERFMTGWSENKP